VTAPPCSRDSFFRGETVLRHGFDPFIVETLMGEMSAHGPTLHAQSTPVRLTKARDGTTSLHVRAADARESEHSGFDCVLFATGRAANTAGLGLERVGLAPNAAGQIEVDPYENTAVDGIHALGDVTQTGYELTPVAIAAGRRLADRLYGGEPAARIAYETVATVVFSHPPIGTVGLTEPQARERYGDAHVRVKQSRFASMMYAFNDEGAKVKTGLKLVLVGPDEVVVGLHCIGPASDEMLQGFAVAVRMGATRADFEASVAIHPTVAEEFVTFGGWGQSKPDAAGAKRPVLPPYLLAPPRSPLAAKQAPARRSPLLTFIAGVVIGGAIAVAVVRAGDRR
jgi:glutathione reductase (NADPH)